MQLVWGSTVLFSIWQWREKTQSLYFLLLLSQDHDFFFFLNMALLFRLPRTQCKPDSLVETKWQNGSRRITTPHHATPHGNIRLLHTSTELANVHAEWMRDTRHGDQWCSRRDGWPQRFFGRLKYIVWEVPGQVSTWQHYPGAYIARVTDYTGRERCCDVLEKIKTKIPDAAVPFFHGRKGGVFRHDNCTEEEEEKEIQTVFGQNLATSFFCEQILASFSM